MATFGEDVSIDGVLRVGGIIVPNLVAGCLFFGDAISPQFASNFGFDPTAIRNGIGDYTLMLLSDPGPNVAAGSIVFALDGLPSVLWAVPGPGQLQVRMNHLDGTPVDNAFSLLVIRLP